MTMIHVGVAIFSSVIALTTTNDDRPQFAGVNIELWLDAWIALILISLYVGWTHCLTDIIITWFCAVVTRAVYKWFRALKG